MDSLPRRRVRGPDGGSAGHLAIRLGKTDLALSALERAMNAADDSSDPLLGAMVTNSVAWNYQRQNRLGDAEHAAVYASSASVWPCSTVAPMKP